MLQINENFLKLPGSYLFAEIGRRVREFKAANPTADVISLGIGDVTRPLAPAVIAALHQAVDDQAAAESFHGYGPEAGYDFLRTQIASALYRSRGAEISSDEIVVGDGAKSDCGNIGDIFSTDAVVAVCDPVYPVYVDTNAMAGRAGNWDSQRSRWDRLIYLPCTAENDFCPEVPAAGDPVPDLIYLCFPNNPTGGMITRERLSDWVAYARRNGSVILYDAAYAAFITEDLPRTIYEIDGAQACAIEFGSFSKLAGFTGVRLGWTVIPKALNVNGTSLLQLWIRRQSTKFNGVSYITQRGGEAVFSQEGREQTAEAVQYYLNNAALIRNSLSQAGFTVFGGINAPYIWMRTPEGLSSWAFFDQLLRRAHVVGTPGSGFGPCGEGYLRLTAFGTQAKTNEAVKRILKVFA